MDPVAQILAQGQLPQGGEGLGQFYFEGKRLGQQQQQINLSQQRLSLEQQQQANENTRANDAHLLAPLVRDHQTAINIQTGATAQGAVLDAQLKADQMAGLNQLTSLQLQAARSPQGILDPVVQSGLTTTLSQHPGLSELPQGAAMITGTAKAKYLQQLLGSGLAPSSITVPNEGGGMDTFGNKASPTADVQDLQYLEKLKQAVVAAPTPEARAAAQSALDDARVKLKVVPEATDATKAVQTRLEEQSAAAANAFTTAKQLIPFLNDASNSGLMGLEQRTQESLKSMAGGVFGFDGSLGKNSATEAAAINTRLKSELIGMARADGNLARSEKQVDMIMSGMPDVTRWFHGASQAKVQLADSISQIGELSRANAKTLGKPITPEWLKPTELFDLYATGKINKRQLDNLQSQNGWEVIKQLRASAIK